MPAILLAVVQTSPALGQAAVSPGRWVFTYSTGTAPAVASMAAAKGRAGPQLQPARRPFLGPNLPRISTPRTRGAVAISRSNAAPTQALGTPSIASLAPQQPGFQLATRYRQISWSGSDQAEEPPDTQLAVGPYNLVEMTNSSASIWSKVGNTGTQAGTLQDQADLNLFYGVAGSPYRIGDPRVLYDPITGRWFASAVGFSNAPFSTRVFLAVSTTSDPAAGWFIYQIGSTASGTAADQPTLGISTDKVVLSWNDFKAGTPSTFSGEETWFIQKADVLGGQAPSETVWGPEPSRFSLVVAQEESPTATVYLAYNGSLLTPPTATPYIGVVAITGTPAQQNLSWNEYRLPIVRTSVPPSAQQPANPIPGTSTLISTNDDRFLSAVWANDVLWVAGNDSCRLPGDTAARSCLKLVKVATSGNVTVTQDADFGVSGAYLYFPAVAMDPSGNMVVAFSQSSATQYASLEASGDLATDTASPPALFSETQVMAGIGLYHCSDGCQIAGADRWGDYSAAALEPCGSANVWVAGEYMGDQSDASDWGTAADSLQVSGSQPPSFRACPWEEHGGALVGGLAASRWSNRLDVFVRQTDGYLYHRFVDDFNPWQWDPYLPPIKPTSDAAAVATATGSVDAFVRGADGGLWRTTYRASTSSGTWEQRAGVLAAGTAPSAVSLGNGDIDVFVEGADRQLWEDRYTSATDRWQWTPRGGVLAGTPAAVSAGPGTAAAVVEGADGALWVWSPSGWSGHGGRLAGRPAAVSSAAGTIDALVEGTDSILYHWSSAITSNGGWETVGGRLAAPPSAASWGGGAIQVLVEGTDSALWRAWTTGGQAPWSWRGHGGRIVGSPAAVTTGTNTLDVFVRGADDGLWNLPFG